MVELNERAEDFKSLDVNVAAISYDSVEQNRTFSSEKGLAYPLLSDVGFETVKALGILNETIPGDSPAFGIAHPGVMLVDPDGKIVLKRAEESYQNRPPWDELLKAVSERLSSSSDNPGG
ncbi:MAG: peroxiredoxin family protein [Pseudomonadales bacterium]|nr:peroxiredoxin family protein [Pseudomonadales bacterium]